VPWQQLRIVFALSAAALVAAGCDRGTKPPGPSTAPAASPSPKLTLIAPESARWDRAAALQHLDEAKLAVSAAVRLVRLSDAAPLSVPTELTDATAARLRLRKLSANFWALGLGEVRDDRKLQAPVLIGLDGGVQTIAEGTDEEAAILYISSDTRVVPHILVTPARVLVLDEALQPALTLASPPEIGFQGRQREGYRYVGLMLRSETGWVEVARYTWDPYELVFEGPAADKLPDPPGGRFALDMDKSPLLIPKGGEIPEPRPRPPEPPRIFTPGWEA
jgi:hypothetical protein